MDIKAIEYHVQGLLKAIGEDPEREGLKDTPARVARMLEEVLEGTAYSNHEIAEMFGTTFSADTNGDTDSTVVMKDITVFSYCEHHLALMYDMTVNVAYIPHGERLGSDICEIISEAAGSPDVGVVIRGSHSCMTARGIRNASAQTVTTTFRGRFRTEKDLQQLIIME